MVWLSRYPPQQRYLRRLIFDYLMKRESCITGSISLEGMKGREWKGGWKGGNVRVNEREGMKGWMKGREWKGEWKGGNERVDEREGMKGWMKGRECKGGWKGGNERVDERQGM